MPVVESRMIPGETLRLRWMEGGLTRQLNAGDNRNNKTPRCWELAKKRWKKKERTSETR